VRDPCERLRAKSLLIGLQAAEAPLYLAPWESKPELYASIRISSRIAASNAARLPLSSTPSSRLCIRLRCQPALALLSRVGAALAASLSTAQTQRPLARCGRRSGCSSRAKPGVGCAASQGRCAPVLLRPQSQRTPFFPPSYIRYSRHPSLKLPAPTSSLEHARGLLRRPSAARRRRI
jgi:hypothetical protein